MFGFRKSRPTDIVNWSQLQPLLEDDDQRAAVERFYPQQGRESFLAALRRIEPQAADAVLTAGRQLERALPLSENPTVAIAGMLNSGKTSLVASFLSQAGRIRSLRGPNTREGTHRFVLWLPEAWRSDPDLWSLLISRIGEALGNPPEMLSDDPEVAHAQYNNAAGDAGLLAVPLVATDPQLDDTGVGLLDCPDIVSDAAFGLGDPEARRHLLGLAATLCSAFLVVTTPEAFRDADLADILRIASDLMPGVPRMLAVNKIRPRQSPEQIWETFRPLAERYRVETIYAAYDFDIAQSQPFIPRPSGDRRPAFVAHGEEALPVFFSLSENPDDNPPAAIADDRFLFAMPAQLDRAQLFERFQLALQAGLRKAIWEDGYDRLQLAAQECAAEANTARSRLLAAALEFFAHREPGGRIAELRLHQSERIIRQLSEAFCKAAPWYARWGVRMNATVRRFIGGASDLVRRFTPTEVARKTADEVKDVFSKGEQGGLLTPERLVAALHEHQADDHLPGHPEPAAIEGLASSVVLRFEREDFTSLDPRRLDQAVAEMWHEVPVTTKLKAGLTPLTAALAAFGAVLMLPLDFGGTVLIAYASIPELLAAAGLSTFAAYWSGKSSANSVGQQAARQQLSDFLAILCDTVGVPRATDPIHVQVAKQSVALPSPNVQTLPPQGDAMVYWRVRETFAKELNSQLPRGE